jgi:hypothetical protein
VIFRQSFEHLVDGLNMYAPYPEEHGDYYKYSPAFALLMAPFHLLPVWLGLVIWNLSGALLLFYGVKSLKPQTNHLFILVVIMAPEIFTSLANSQSNLHLAGLYLFCFSALEKQKHGTAAFLLMVGVFIKIFAIAFLPLWLFYGRKSKAALWLGFYFLLFAFGPALVTGTSELIWQYQNWLALLKQDHDASVGLGLLGLLQAITTLEINKSAILIFGFLLLAVPLVRIKSYRDPAFRLCYFCLLMIWVVLFNHKAESPTFIIPFAAVSAYAIYYGFDKVSWFFLVGHLIFTSLSVGDLVPLEIRHNFVEP